MKRRFPPDTFLARIDGLDADEQDRACSLKQHLVFVGIELAHPPVASRQSASDSLGGRLDRLSNASRCPLLAAIISSRSSRASVRTGATLGSISVVAWLLAALRSRALRSFANTVFAEPCSPDTASSG
jgi:hypothetical protein